MFSVDGKKPSPTTMPIITDNHHVILFHEVPILFTGTNEFGNHIIGSSVDEDYEKGFERYYHIIVTINDFSSYIHRKATYRSLLEKARPIYVIDKYVESGLTKIYEYTIGEIPKRWLPAVDTYCPQEDLPASFTYPVSLEGKLADIHQAIPEEVSGLQTKLSGFLKSPFRRLKINRLNNVIPVIALEASYAPSSFRINYKVTFEKEAPPSKKEESEAQTSLFDETELNQRYNQFLNEYISYCINHLSQDIEALLEHRADIDNGVFRPLLARPKFDKLCELYRSLVGLGKLSQVEAERTLIEDLLKCVGDLGDLSDTIGKHYSQIALANVSVTGIENLLGIIGDTNKKELDDLILTVDTKTGVEKSIDEEQEYRVYIYDLNTDTRTGHAYMERAINNKVAKPKIKISGSEPLTRTKYTASMHNDEYITVRGKASRVDGVPRHIDIIFESE